MNAFAAAIAMADAAPERRIRWAAGIFLTRRSLTQSGSEAGGTNGGGARRTL